MRNKFCPHHGDPEEAKHLVSHCTCTKNKKFPINLIGSLVAVKPEELKAEVLLPDWKRSLTGSLIAKGPDVHNVNIGDRVVFGAAVGMDATIAGQAVRILKEENLDFVYEEVPEESVAERIYNELL